MTETLRKLLELQRLDTELFAIEQQMRRVPLELRKEQAAYEQAVQELHREEQARRHVDEERVRQEQSLASAAERIKQLKAKQGQVKKNQEYQALTHEIQLAEESNSRHRTALERVREQRAAADAAVAQRLDAVAARKQQFMRRAEQAKQAIAALLERKKMCRAARKELVTTINPDALALYEKLLKTRAPRVLVPVDPVVKVCTGCNIQLTEQVIADIMRSDRLVLCETCARILYLDNTEAR